MNKFLSVHCGRLAIILSLLLAFPAGSSAAIPARTAQIPQDPDAPLAVTPNSSYLYIPAAAYEVGHFNYDYENHGRFIKNTTEAFDHSHFRAAVKLPHGAIIRSVGFCFFDDSPTKNATAWLYRDERGSSEVEMATATTTFSTGYMMLLDSSIVDSTVDNVELGLLGRARRPVFQRRR